MQHPLPRGEDIVEHGPIYCAIERALWALAPALILLLALAYPSMQATRQIAVQTDIAVAAENSEYCVKWGMAAGTPQHLDCIHDLVAIRARSEQRVQDEAVNDF